MVNSQPTPWATFASHKIPSKLAIFKTIVISDVHLGTKDSKAKELANFLRHNHCHRLILNGDIVDAWNLKRRGKWKKNDTRVFRRILEMIERYDTEVIYIRGNHDDFLDKLIPFVFGGIRIVNNYELKSGNLTYFITHGDIFDVVSSKFKWLAIVGDIGYKILLWLNRRHNRKRALLGLPYDSVSQKIKQKVKLAVNFISDFETVMVEYAKARGYQGIICGHIHKPENKMIDGIHYLNSGDWVETLSALVEHQNGKWDVINYHTLIHPEISDELFEDKLQIHESESEKASKVVMVC